MKQQHPSLARVAMMRREQQRDTAKHPQQFGDLASEFRAIRSAGNFPHALAMLRAAMVAKRAEFRLAAELVRLYRL